jgi:hypothetical protein
VTVGFHSPLPPQRTGVADYSAALLDVLRRRVTVRVNARGDVNLYHIGNNQLHASIYRQALVEPGVVVLHDAVLHHFMLGSLSRDGYLEEFAYNYGDWTRSLAESLWQGRSRSASDPQYFQYAMVKRIAERSRAVIVHNPAAAAIVRQHHAGANVIEVPHLLIPHPRPHAADAERLRASFGPGLHFGIFGHLRESKRVLPILRLFARLPEFTLLLAGAMASSDLRRACAPYLSAANVQRIGYLPPEAYWRAAMAVDVCINLRYPAAGETSGITLGMMGVGTPVLMSDSVENSQYPEGTCVKASPGVAETPEVEAFAGWAIHHRATLRDIGLEGRAHVRRYHDPENATELYLRALDLH